MQNVAFADRLGHALATKRHCVLVDGDFEVVRRDAGNLSGDDGPVGTRPDVHQRELGRRRYPEAVHQAIHIVLHKPHLAERIEPAPRISLVSEHHQTPLLMLQG
jgi:hypothetical protein